MTNDEDKTSVSLIQRACGPDGDKDSVNDVCSFYGPKIVLWAIARGVKRVDADDLAQEVLIVLEKKLVLFKYDENQTFRGYLRTILRFKLFEYWRMEQGRKISESFVYEYLSDDKNNDELVDLFVEHEGRLELELLLRESRARAKKNGWKDETWESWELSVRHGMEDKDIAEKLGLNIASVYVNKPRVKELIAEVAMDLGYRGEDFTPAMVELPHDEQ